MGLPDDYLLCVGNITPVKNHITAVRALHEIREAVPTNLVIAGGQTNGYFHKLQKEVQRLGLDDRVYFTGFVSGEGLVSLMNGAKILLFPSLTEGFGLTMLEASGCGLPIVASRRGSLPDLGRGQALFVDDPNDHHGFAKEVLRVLSSPDLRHEMAEKGLAMARTHTWDSAARAHLQTYRRCYEQRRASKVA
jgi:glycosyltransferase involved in cell wall biosynthesis